VVECLPRKGKALSSTHGTKKKEEEKKEKDEEEEEEGKKNKKLGVYAMYSKDCSSECRYLVSNVLLMCML
jgi:hypothetical protein